MTKEEKIAEICQQSMGMLHEGLSSAISNAIIEGYKLGCYETAERFGIKLED